QADHRADPPVARRGFAQQVDLLALQFLESGRNVDAPVRPARDAAACTYPQSTFVIQVQLVGGRVRQLVAGDEHLRTAVLEAHDAGVGAEDDAALRVAQ